MSSILCFHLLYLTKKRHPDVEVILCAFAIVKDINILLIFLVTDIFFCFHMSFHWDNKTCLSDSMLISENINIYVFEETIAEFIMQEFCMG